jgi:hypothetical protein
MHLVMDIIPNEPRGDSSMHEIKQYTIAKMKIMFKKIRGPKKEGA